MWHEQIMVIWGILIPYNYMSRMNVRLSVSSNLWSIQLCTCSDLGRDPGTSCINNGLPGGRPLAAAHIKIFILTMFILSVFRKKDCIPSRLTKST